MGAIVVVSLGLVLEWYWISVWCGAALVVWCVAVVPWFPESPTVLAISGREEEARRVLR